MFRLLSTKNPGDYEILIVDDHAANLQVLINLLQDIGYKIRPAISGKLALRAVQKKKPDLILLDIVMPGLNGIEVCRRLKADPATSHIPVLFLSALNEPQHKVEAFAAGGVDYITKPFQAGEVRARVETHLSLRLARLELEQSNQVLAGEIQKKEAIAEALRQSEERYQRIFENTHTVMLLINLENGRIVDANLGACQFYGYSKSEFNGLPVQQIMDLPAEQLQELLEIPDPSVPKNLRVQHKLANGDGRQVEMHGGMLVMGNQELLFLIVQDITEKWQTEQENTRLQEKDRLAALGQMAAGIAHDFNNIMAVITLYTQLVLYDESLSQKTQHHLQTVDEQASRASELIQQILDFSRNTRLERKPLNLVPFMKEQIKLLQRTLPETIFITFTNKSASVMALVDPTRIQQVMMNLSLNARDAIEGDGKLQISLEDQQFDTENELPLPDMTPGRWLKLAVTDNGHGMLPEITARIFEPFFTTKAPNEGTGLGLAQVYGIIQQHNGHIQVFSKPNWGTTFNIYLPSLVNPETDRKSKQDQSLPLGNSEVILVAEDDSSIQTAVAASLEMLNYRVILAQDGYEALAELKHNRGEIDLILSDVVMPKMGGVELLVAVREMGFTLPIVLMTGYMVEKSVQALRPFQPTPIINKPWQLSELADVLQEQLKPETGV